MTRGQALHHGDFAICILVSFVATIAKLFFGHVLSNRDGQETEPITTIISMQPCFHLFPLVITGSVS